MAAAHWPARLQQSKAGAGQVPVAERNHRPVGFICLLAPDGHGSVHVDKLHALPAHKGSGAGTAMLEAALRWARGRGADGLHLFVMEANPVVAGFYASRGWRLAAREDHQMGGTDVVVRRYVLPLERQAA